MTTHEHTNELHPEACRCALCAPEDGGDEAMTEHDKLHEEWKRLEAEAEAEARIAREAVRKSNEAWARSYRAELALLDAEDRSQTPRADWIRCHLAGDHDGADLALAAMYPESETAKEAARRVRLSRGEGAQP